MKAGVVIFPGSNCDKDTIHVLQDVYGLQTISLWHKDTDLQGCDIIFIPGGFSFGDYLRAGAVARFSPMMDRVMEFGKNGGYIIGICNGFQVLCESHLLPGVLRRNVSQKFTCKNVWIKSVTADSLITRGIPVGQPLKIPIAHAEGSFYAAPQVLEELQSNDQILFRYCGPNGEIAEEFNPNGSLEDIAGICNKERNIFGMMPHPERASEEALGNTDGRFIFDSIFKEVEAQLEH
ncbi:MAG: phosphoribosylformylglycinamidine synthase subunit PurQ [Bacteroidota bacterium]|nr:phosphoribosylformylglycinamidine synthase subunit PurQ [Bacteroidota bacterium]